MLPLAKLHEDVTECYISEKRFLRKFVNDYAKVRDIAIIQVNIEVQQIVFAI